MRASTVLFVLGFVLSTSACATVTGNNTWQRVRSAHFELLTDGSVEKARKRVETFEVFRHFVLGYTNVSLPEDLPRFRIVAPANMRSYETLRPRSADVVGYYTARATEAIAVFSLDEDFEVAVLVALHEFVHHLQYQGGAPPMPSWYMEGLADYLGSFVLQDDRILIGRPQEVRTGWLSNTDDADWLDYAQVVSGDFEANDVEPSLFYAQSWILTHYLVNREREELRRYIEAYAQNPRQDHFETVFGVSPRGMGLRAKAYYAQGRLPVQAFARPELGSIPITVTPLPVEERDYLLTHLGVGRLPLERIQALLADRPASDIARLSLAEALRAAEQPKEALAEVRALLAARSQPTPRARALEALLLFEQADKAPPRDQSRQEDLQAALAAAIQTNREDPDNVRAFEVIARVGAAGGPVKDKDVLASLETAQILAPHRHDLILVEARFRAERDDEDGARTLAEQLYARSFRPSLRDAAQKLLTDLGSP